MDATIKAPAFSARVLEKLDNGKGYWNSLRIGVLDGDDQIGEYKRNYHSYGEATFFPFEQGGKWFALYSPDYTGTRLMSLPDCKDIGGEERCSGGFCPVEYYVPTICERRCDPSDVKPVVANHQPQVWATIAGNRYYWPDDADHPNPDETRKAAYLKACDESHAAADAWCERNPSVTQFAQWGFVAGCVWGDDCSWKIQFLDLSQASQGIVKRDHRFGYIELPSGLSLQQAIDVDRFEHDSLEISIAIPQRFTLDGKPVKEDA